MPLVFEEVHATSDRKKVNEEWFVMANNGSSPISSAGLNVVVMRKGKRGSVLGQIDPGFVLAPGEKVLVLSGSPGKKSQGTIPEKPDCKTYYLFSHEPLLAGDGTTIRWTLNQLDVAKVVYSASAPNGIASE